MQILVELVHLRLYEGMGMANSNILTIIMTISIIIIPMQILVELAHLRSYKGMGMANSNILTIIMTIIITIIPMQILVELAHLRSYEGMGMASLFLHQMRVSQSDECIVAISVMPETDSGHRKVKLAGLMVCEEADDLGVSNFGAVEMVNVNTGAPGSTGVFDVSKMYLGK
eukprot:gene10223-8140_t